MLNYQPVSNITEEDYQPDSNITEEDYQPDSKITEQDYQPDSKITDGDYQPDNKITNSRTVRLQIKMDMTQRFCACANLYLWAWRKAATRKMFGSSAFSGGSAAQNPNKDIAVTQPPNDSISKLAFSPTANYLIASSWDNNVSS